jgi:hypothetical protein
VRIIWAAWWWRWYAEICRSVWLDITIKWSFWCICWFSKKTIPIYYPNTTLEHCTFIYILFCNVFRPLYSAVVRQKHKDIIGKVCDGRGVCRVAAQLSVRRDVNWAAVEGRLLDKNGIRRCLVGSYFTLVFLGVPTLWITHLESANFGKTLTTHTLRTTVLPWRNPWNHFSYPANSYLWKRSRARNQRSRL